MVCDICKCHTYVVYINFSHEKTCGKCFDEQTEKDICAKLAIRQRQKHKSKI